MNGTNPEWAQAPLGALVRPSKEKVDPQAVPDAPYLSLEHLQSGTNRIVGAGKAAEVTSTKAVFKSGDVLYGKLRPYLNKVARPTFDGVCSTDILVFKENGKIDNGFLLYWLSQKEVVEYANHNMKGNSLPRVAFEDLARLPILYPPLDEQRRIAARLDDLLGRVASTRERLDRVPAILRRFRQSVLAAAFTGALSAEWRTQHGWIPSAADGEDALPAGWSWSTLGAEFEVKIGATPRRNEPSYWNGAIPWVSSGEVQFCRIDATREQITEAGLKNTSTQLNPEGTVLLGMIGEGRTRGQAAILDVPACNNQNSAAIWVSSTATPPEWVYFWLQFHYEETRGRGTGGAQPALNKRRVEAIPIPMTTPDEQRYVVSRIAALFKSTAAVDSRAAFALAKADSLVQAILARAFCGELTN
jgi:type I restriction enzyme S subunit